MTDARDILKLESRSSWYESVELESWVEFMMPTSLSKPLKHPMLFTLPAARVINGKGVLRSRTEHACWRASPRRERAVDGLKEAEAKYFMSKIISNIFAYTTSALEASYWLTWGLMGDSLK